MSDWTFPAEATLAAKTGTSVNKAGLLLVLLRAHGLTANYMWARITLKMDFVWRMAPDWAWKHFPSVSSPHVVVVV